MYSTMCKCIIPLPISSSIFPGGGDAESEEDLKEGGGAGERASDQKVSELLSTKKAAVIPLPEDHTVMQISCGAFHTGKYCI